MGLQQSLNKIEDGLSELRKFFADFGGTPARAPRAAASAKTRAKKSTAAKDKPKAVKAKKAAKRDPEALAALQGSLEAYVIKNPSQGIEIISKALGKTTKELVLPMRKLLAEGRVKTVGEKRSTRYLPGKKAGSPRAVADVKATANGAAAAETAA